MLDAQNKNSAKSAAINSNPALAGQLLADLEETVNKLKEDHEALKGKQDKDVRGLYGELDRKASK